MRCDEHVLAPSAAACANPTTCPDGSPLNARSSLASGSRTRRISFHLGCRALDEVDERSQRRRHQASPRVIEEGPGEILPPSFEDGFELAALEMRTEPIFEVIDDAGPGDRRVDREISSPAQDHEQRSRGINPHHLAVALELP